MNLFKTCEQIYLETMIKKIFFDKENHYLKEISNCFSCM